MGKFWQGVAAVCAVLAIVGFLFATHFRKLYLSRPVLPTAPLVTKPDTTTQRPDTVKWVPPEMKATISALQARLAIFMADSTRGLDSCVVLLAQADTLIDSLKTALSQPPEVSLTLSDSTLPYLWPTVTYKGVGTLGISQWGYRFFKDKWPREKKPPGRGVGRIGIAGAVQTATRESRLGGRIRIKQNIVLEGDKPLGEKGWWAGISYFFL